MMKRNITLVMSALLLTMSGTGMANKICITNWGGVSEENAAPYLITATIASQVKIKYGSDEQTGIVPGEPWKSGIKIPQYQKYCVDSPASDQHATIFDFKLEIADGHHGIVTFQYKNPSTRDANTNPHIYNLKSQSLGQYYHIESRGDGTENIEIRYCKTNYPCW